MLQFALSHFRRPDVIPRSSHTGDLIEDLIENLSEELITLFTLHLVGTPLEPGHRRRKGRSP